MKRMSLVVVAAALVTGCGAGSKLAEKDAEITSLQGHVATMQGRMGELEQDYADAQARAERLEAELAEMAEAEKLYMERLEGMSVIRLPEEVLFKSGSAWVLNDGRKLLGRLAEILNRYPEREIQVQGHTDNRPLGAKAAFHTNWELSTARATNVVRLLIDEYDFEPARLAAVGYGEYRPVASNDTDAGRSQNRRVEIHVSMPPKVDELPQ